MHLAEAHEPYNKKDTGKMYKRLYSTGSTSNNEGFSQSYLIRKGYEETDMQEIPAGNYWWQDENGKVKKIEKK